MRYMLSELRMAVSSIPVGGEWGMMVAVDVHFAAGLEHFSLEIYARAGQWTVRLVSTAIFVIMLRAG